MSRRPNENGSQPVQFGLVAEEVAEVFPELVVPGKDGKLETVGYHVLGTLLLNELQKEHRVVEALRQDNEAQLARMAALEQQVAILAKAVERADRAGWFPRPDSRPAKTAAQTPRPRAGISYSVYLRHQCTATVAAGPGMLGAWAPPKP